MAQHGSVKIDVTVVDSYSAALLRTRRHISGMGLAVELASTVTPEQIESVLETLRANEGHDKSATDARWIADVTPQFEKMVTDGIAWLIATQEYVAGLEAVTDNWTDEDHLAAEGKV